jgi:hypothetical protein
VVEDLIKPKNMIEEDVKIVSSIIVDIVNDCQNDYDAREAVEVILSGFVNKKISDEKVEIMADRPL